MPAPIPVSRLPLTWQKAPPVLTLKPTPPVPDPPVIVSVEVPPTAIAPGVAATVRGAWSAPWTVMSTLAYDAGFVASAALVAVTWQLPDLSPVTVAPLNEQLLPPPVKA